MFGDKMTSERPFEYTIDRVRTRFSNPEIVESLKRFAKVHGVETFGMREYDAWDQHILSAERIRVRFHGWGKALQAAGLRAQRSSLDLKEMVSAFKACWRQHMSVPSRRQLEAYLEQNNFPFRWKSYMNVWGGLQSLAKLVVDVEGRRVSESMLYRRATAVNTRRPISLVEQTTFIICKPCALSVIKVKKMEKTSRSSSHTLNTNAPLRTTIGKRWQKKIFCKNPERNREV